eukprot:5462591-Alexandrium_andersonii.AAC.1
MGEGRRRSPGSICQFATQVATSRIERDDAVPGPVCSFTLAFWGFGLATPTVQQNDDPACQARWLLRRMLVDLQGRALGLAWIAISLHV